MQEKLRNTPMQENFMYHRRFVDDGHYFAVNIDDLGTIGRAAAYAMVDASTKKARKSAFVQLKKIFALLRPGMELFDVALGCDKNGVACIFFITAPREG